MAEGGGDQVPRAVFFRLFPSIAVPMFLAAVDQTIVATALPAIAADLGQVERVPWVVVSFLIATSVSAPIYGRLGDAYGRRRMLLGALAMLLVGSVLCAFAQSIETLSAARAIQGFGGGGLMTLSQALIGETIPPRQRGRFQGYLAAIFLCASTIGPLLGGLLAENFGWRSVFLVNLPLGVLAVLLALRLEKGRAPGGRFGAVLDLPGVAMFAVAAPAALLGLESLRHPTSSHLITAAVLLPLSVVLVWLLLKWEARVTAPLLPIALLRKPAVWMADGLALCHGATMISLIAFLPFYLQVVRGATPAESGLILLPMTGGIAVGALIAGRIMSRTGGLMTLPSVGMSCFALGLFGLAVALPVVPTNWLPVWFAVLSPMLGTVMPAVQTTVQMAAGGAQLGAAASSVALARSLGAAVGAALTGTILFAAAALIAGPGGMAAVVTLLESGPAGAATLSEQALAVARVDLASAFRVALAAIGSYAAIAAVLAWRNPQRRVE
ncbi:MFS transporter [Humitalea sp. 24SJ18S-53]|uniref:MFS transporter n=1 Tax=Humitalea sp. 24SJ18S-53 TaxID=3422307 RepID=UPI003D66961E